MKFEEEFEFSAQGRSFDVFIDFECDARVTHYLPARRNCSADDSYDSELEYKVDEVTLKEIDFTMTFDGEAFSPSLLSQSDMDKLNEQLVVYANHFANEHDWSLEELGVA